MELNSRCIQVLQQLVREKDGLRADELITQLTITRRMLTYDLGKVGDWLASHKLGKVETVSGRLFLRTESPGEIERLLGSFSSLVFSVEERRTLELLFIALSASPVTSGTLQVLLGVSKNTILGDIKECRAQLEPLSLRIGTAGKRGYLLEGDEVAVRKLIGQQLLVLGNDYSQSLLGDLLQHSLEVLTGNDQIDFHQLVKEGVEDYERSLGTWLVFGDQMSPETMILSACIRSVMGFPYPLDALEKEALKNTREYSAVLLILHKLFDANINLRMDEAYYITILFLGIKNFDFDSAEAENDFIQEFSQSLVDNFERIACVSFEDKRQFLGRLYQHVRPMYYRLKYGIRMGATFFDQIRAMYESVYIFTRDALERTHGEMSGLIVEEELAYLCVYMASYLGAETAQPQRAQLRILIICGAGVAASVLLREQLADLLGDTFEYKLVPARQAEELELSSYCLVVTTVPLETEDDRVIQTGPILSEQSRDRITDIICQTSGEAQTLQEITDLLEIIRNHAAISDEPKLRRELIRHAIRKERRGEVPTVPPNLKKLLESGRIRFSNAETIEEAVSDATEQMDFTPSGRWHFTKALLARIKSRPEPYDLAPGVMLEHCRRPSEGVDLNIIIFRKPVKWGRQKIRILVILATVDNFTHFPLLHELYYYLKDERLLRTLLAQPDGNAAAELLLAQIEKEARV